MSDIIAKCRITGKEFLITEEDQKFYKKMRVPLPTLCPEERCRRRLSWQNMRKLYNRKCDATGVSIISNISPNKPFPVYNNPYWWSDKWDFRNYGKEYDFSRPFFDQFKELLQVVPQPNLGRSYLLDENSDYTNYAGGNKNCYLIFHADLNRDCMYGVGVKKCENSLDILHVMGSELLYECVDCRSCYDLKYCQDCENSSNSWFLKDCYGCKNCFGCVNLKQKEYHIYNKPVSKEEFSTFIQNFHLGKYSVIEKTKKEFAKLQQQYPHKAFQGYQNENCTGDRIYRCQNVHDSFDIQESRDMGYCHRVYNGLNSDCYDVNEFGLNIQEVYEGLAVGINAYHVVTGVFVNEQVSNIFYSIHVHHAQNCFGCIGISRGEYCILNKQYTKEEYEEMLPKIINHMKKTGEWGEFFPLEISPFGYNETVANEYFPLSKEEALQRGYQWENEDIKSQYQGLQYKIPDDIKDVSNDICQAILSCEVTGQNYKILPEELKFYKSMNIPIPRKHPNLRHMERFGLQNPRKLWNRKCAKCNTDIKTSYSPERPEIVYCEECYLKEVY